jgi:hypothetical protein
MTDFETLMDVGFAAASFRTIDVMVHPGAHGHDEETAQLEKSWIDVLPYKAKLISYLDL